MENFVAQKTVKSFDKGWATHTFWNDRYPSYK